jgi:DNA-binding NarL/FixJ family response regulator
MDGKTLLKRLAGTEVKSMKIVVNTNLSDSKTEREVLRLGADKLILKSDVGPLELVKLVREMTVV